MTIRKKKFSGKIEIDISGPQGNAFVIMGYARQYAKQLELDPDKVIEDMKADGDYDGLLRVFDQYFGEYIDLVY